MKKYWIFLIPLFLAGCWDVKEPERMLYLHGLGVDFQDEEYIVYAQIIDFSIIAKGEQPANPDAVQAEVGRATGSSIADAVHELYESLDQELFWGHFSYLLFSQEALAAGQGSKVVDTFIRFHNTRYNTWVYSTEDPVKDVMLSVPVINRAISLSKLSDPLNSFQQLSVIKPLSLRQFIIGLNEPSYEARIPLVELKKNFSSQKKKNREMTKVSGVTVVTPDTVKGIIKGEEVQGLQWMTNQTVRSTFSTPTDKNISVALTNIQVKVKPIVTDSSVTFDIQFEAIANLISLYKSLTTEDIKKTVQEQVEKQIRDTYKVALEEGADIYRLSEQLYRHDVKAWKRLQDKGQIPLTEESLGDIQIHVARVQAGRKEYKETIR